MQPLCQYGPEAATCDEIKSYRNTPTGLTYCVSRVSRGGVPKWQQVDAATCTFDTTRVEHGLGLGEQCTESFVSRRQTASIAGK